MTGKDFKVALSTKKETIPPDPARSCAFTGHRRLTASQHQRCEALLTMVIPRLVRGGVNRFCAGGALGFDTLAAETLLDLRDRRGLDLTLTIAVPCPGQDAKWPPALRKKYREILDRADSVELLADEYYSGCMQARNRYMVDRSERLIAFWIPDQTAGGTAMTVNYALKQGRKVLNLYDYLPEKGPS